MHYCIADAAHVHGLSNTMYDNWWTMLQVRGYWAGCMMTAALNLALIVTLGSGLSEAHTYGQKNYNDSARTAAPGSKGYGTNPNELAGGNGNTVV